MRTSGREKVRLGKPQMGSGQTGFPGAKTTFPSNTLLRDTKGTDRYECCSLCACVCDAPCCLPPWPAQILLTGEALSCYPSCCSVHCVILCVLVASEQKLWASSKVRALLPKPCLLSQFHNCLPLRLTECERLRECVEMVLIMSVSCH